MRPHQWTRSTRHPDEKVFQHGIKSLSSASVPRKVDLRNYCSPVFDQGQIGSCTANGILAILEWLENFNNDKTFTHLSRLFVYFNERYIEGTVKQDAGAQISDGIKSIFKTGVCAEALWPYDEAKFEIAPDEPAYADALTRKYAEAQRVDGVHGMIACLASGFPFVFGTAVDEDTFCSQDLVDGEVQMITGQEKNLGGHCMSVFGYDLDYEFKTQPHLPPGAFIVRNSWGPDWGLGGYCLFPLAYLGNDNWTGDSWTIRSDK